MLLSSSFNDQLTMRVVGGNLPVNAGASDLRDISAHNSPTLVRSPADGRNVVVANRVDAPSFSCALHVSTNGGTRFAQTPIPVPRGEEPKCYAPDVVFDADGTLYLSFVTLKGSGNVPNAVWLSSSKDGGRTITSPRRVLGPLAFQVRLMADPVVPRKLYVTWLQASDVGLFRFAEPGNPIRFSRTSDGGKNWQRPTRVSAPSRPRVLAPVLAVGEDELSVLYLDVGEDLLDYEGAHEGKGGPPYPGSWKLVLAQSDDDGAQWSESVVEDNLRPTERFLAFLPPFPSLAIDRDSGRTYAAFEDGRSGDADVLVWASGDGESWEQPVRVNDTKKGDGTAQYRPQLAVAPNGRLDVLYYDRRQDKRNVRNEVSLQSSLDGAESFSPRRRLSDRPFDSRIGFGSDRDMPDLGNRLGLISTDDRALAVWTDTRAGTRDSRKQDLSRALVALSDPTRLAGPLEYGLRYGGLLLGLLGLATLAREAMSVIRERRRIGSAGKPGVF